MKPSKPHNSIIPPPCSEEIEEEISGDYAAIVNGTMPNLVMRKIKLIPDNTNLGEACKEGRANDYIHMPKAVKEADMEYLQDAQNGKLSEIPESGTPERAELQERIMGMIAITEANTAEQYDKWTEMKLEQDMTNKICEEIFEKHKKALWEAAMFTEDTEQTQKEERTSTVKPLKKTKS